MEDLIELATYNDDDYGLIVQFLDENDNCIFYQMEEINGEKKYTKVDETINRMLEEKYFSMENTTEE